MAAPEAIHPFPIVLNEEDYIDLERKSGARYEFFGGGIFPIPNPSFNHRIVTANLNRHLDKLLKGGCSIGSADLRLKVEATGLLTYPDVFVVTGAMELAHPDSLLNPAMIAEVMSPLTKYTPSPAGLRSESWSTTTLVVYSSPRSSLLRSRAVVFQPQTTT